MPYPLPPPDPAALVEVARGEQLELAAPVLDETTVHRQLQLSDPFLATPAPVTSEVEALQLLPHATPVTPESADRLAAANTSAQALGHPLGLNEPISPALARPALSEGNRAAAPLFSPLPREPLAQNDDATAPQTDPDAGGEGEGEGEIGRAHV